MGKRLSDSVLRPRLQSLDEAVRKRAKNALWKREQRDRDRRFKPARADRLEKLEEEDKQRKERKARREHLRQQREETQKWADEIRINEREQRAIEKARDPTKGKKSRTKDHKKIETKIRNVFGPKIKGDNELMRKLKIVALKPNGEEVSDDDDQEYGAFNKTLVDYIVKNNGLSLNGFIHGCRPLVIQKILERAPVKTLVRFQILFGKTDPSTGIEETNLSFLTGGKMYLHLNPTEQSACDYYDDVIEKLMIHINNYQDKGSGWYVKEVKRLVLATAKYVPDYGGSWIPTPKGLKKNRSTINPKNEDNECFRWAILTALHPEKKHNVSRNINALKKHKHKYNWAGVDFPSSIKDYKQFEENNENIALTVYKWGRGRPLPLYTTTKNNNAEHKVYLLNLTEVVGKDHPEYKNNNYNRKTHFIVISNISAFRNKFFRLGCDDDDRVDYRKRYHCEKCALAFTTEDKLKQHNLYCGSDEPYKIFPGGELMFKNYHKKVQIPIRTISDFESSLEPMNEQLGSKTTQTHHHKPNSFSTVTVRFDGKIKSKTYREKNPAKEYLKHLTEVVKDFHSEFKNPKPLVITPEIEAEYNTATHCWICEEVFGKEIHPQRDPRNPDQMLPAVNPKVRDHCHYTGDFRGIAHNLCNLKLTSSVMVPNLIHHMMGYDIYLFLRELSEQPGMMRVLAKDSENLIALYKDVAVEWGPNPKKPGHDKPTKVVKLVFLDSRKFLNESLDSLVKVLPKDKMVVTKHEFPDPEQFNLVTQKGVYPYEYIDSLDRFKETKLPPWDKWYNTMTGKHITPDEQEHVLKVWNTFNCKTLGDYHDIYLKSDTTLLADVFENFINVCYETRGLDPLHYVTFPGYAWDCCLKQSGVELELFEPEQADMYEFFKRGTRGGVSMATKRYAEANNPYLKDYNPDEPTCYIMNFDRNSLYAGCEKEPLPTGGFEWMEPDELENLQELLSHPTLGCNLEVDFEYPDYLHDLHKDLPFAPCHEEVNGVKKLMSTLHNKTNQVVYYKLLDFYVRHGLKITKIHRGISYYEEPWMRSFVELNTDLRRQANIEGNKADKNLFKLMSNAPYGKTIEDVTKRGDVTLVRNEQKFKNKIRQPNFKEYITLAENSAFASMKKMFVKMDKPSYVGQVILDIAKLKMYEFFFEYLKPKYGDKVELLITDTDSFIILVYTDDIYKDMQENMEWFDTSNYPKDHKLYSETNNSDTRCMKDECGGYPIKKCVALGPKQYSLVVERGDEEQTTSKCKGISKAVTSNELKFNEYYKCLVTKKPKECVVPQIQSRNHTLHTEKTRKVALTFEDNKRVIMPDGIHTLPLGHYSLREKQ